MQKRFVLIGIATLIALLVLVASIFMGPDATNPDGDGDNIPGTTDIDISPSADAVAHGFTYTVLEENSDGERRVTRLLADRATSAPRGVTQLVAPRAEIIFSPQRAMTITSNNADFIMDGNQPQSGVFKDHVVLTFYEAPIGQSIVIDETNPEHVQYIARRIFIDGDTRFDLDGNEVRSDGPIHVTSLQVDFHGIGLTLKYNTARERIEHLVIHEGRYLMFNPDAPSESALAEDGNTSEAENPSDPISAQEPTVEPGPSQYYLATFADNVVVREAQRSVLGGDELMLRFSLGTEAVELQPLTNDSSSFHLSPPLPGWRQVQAGDDIIAPSDLLLPFIPAAIPAVNDARSLFDYDPARDVVVTWDGPLRLVPLSTKPERLADDSDVLINLLGSAFAQTTRDEKTDRIEANELEYLTSTEQVAAVGLDGQPILITSSAMGTLTGSQLVIDQQAGTGYILGPGTLTQNPDEEGKSLTLTWQNRLDLELIIVKVSGTFSDPADRSRTRIVGIKTATFQGTVTADHPDFQLAADRLAIQFTPADKARDINNAPQVIDASGDVSVTARGDAEDEIYTVDSQSLVIHLERDVATGDVYASAMRAIGEVRLSRPGSTLTCRRVDVALSPPPADDAQAAENPGTNADEKPYAQVRSLIAVDDVRAELDYDGRIVHLVADNLLADVAEDRLTLYATQEGTLAEVIDVGEDRLLRGRHIVMDDQAKTLRIQGPGSLASRLDDPDQPGNPDANLTVEWATEMRFNNLTGEALFVGDVEANSRRSMDLTEITAPTQLELVFDVTQQVALEGEEEPPIEALDAREIRSAIATGSEDQPVRFMAATFAGLDNDLPESRITMTGEVLTFTNLPAEEDRTEAVETVVINGAGWMLIEDNSQPAEGDEQQATQEVGVSFSGQGQTAFFWTDHMELDAQTNTATFVGNAQMLHDPTPRDRSNADHLSLDCDTLIADMEDTGGLSVWMGDEPPDAKISRVTAEGSLQILREGREIRGDHLLYVAQEETVEIWADAGKDVWLSENNNPAPVTARRLHWDLANDRIEIIGQRGGVAPARR